MPITCKGVFSLQDVRDATLDGSWVCYNLTTDPGCLFLWGSNSLGQLGNNSVSTNNSPIQLPGSEWLAVSGNGGNHSLAIKGDGTLWAWGNNENGQLGNELGPTGGVARPRSSPVQVTGSGWCAVSAGATASMALKTDGTMFVWGCDTLGGTLGTGVREVDRSVPTQIPGVNWCRISRGNCHSLALKTDGTLWAWGCNNDGRVGDQTTSGRSSPVQIPGTNWCGISAFGQNSHALKTDGTLWGWGRNEEGQLGRNCVNPSGDTSPVQIPGASWCKICNSFGTAFALKTDGTLWAWGCNTNGQLGVNNAVNRSSPVQVPGSSWCAIAARNNATYGIKTDNTLWAWGSGSATGLCCGFDISSPIQIPGTSWISVNAGSQHTMARKI